MGVFFKKLLIRLIKEVGWSKSQIGALARMVYLYLVNIRGHPRMGLRCPETPLLKDV